MRLIAANVHLLVCPPDKGEKTFFDDDLPGFGLRVRSSGAQSWLFQYAVGGVTKKVFLGAPGVVDAGAARRRAKDLAAAVRLGGNPADEKAMSRVKAGETFGALLPRFLERQRSRLKPRSFAETTRHLVKHCKALHSSPVTAIDRRAIAKRLTELAETSGAAASNRARGSLSAYFSWLAKSGLCDANPVAYTDKAVEGGARDRVLTDSELGRIWRALDDGDYGAIVKLLMLTGARRDEIASLCWSEVNFETATITLPPTRTKIGREHVIPLSGAAVAVLQARRQQADGSRDLVFGAGHGRGYQGWSFAKRQLDVRLAAAGEAVINWTLHDFRRALSTALNERFNVAPHVVETILGHVGYQSPIAAVYNKAQFFDERRRALARWGEHIIALASGAAATAQVVKLR